MGDENEIGRRQAIKAWAKEFRRLTDNGENPEELLASIGVVNDDDIPSFSQRLLEMAKNDPEIAKIALEQLADDGPLGPLLEDMLQKAGVELKDPSEAAVQCQLEFRGSAPQYSMAPGAVMATDWPGVFRLLQPAEDPQTREQLIVEHFFHARDLLRVLIKKKIAKPSIIVPTGGSRIFGPQG